MEEPRETRMGFCKREKAERKFLRIPNGWLCTMCYFTVGDERMDELGDMIK